MVKKVAVLFFGLTRSVTDTIDSIRQYLFQPILETGMEYDVFIHTYQINGSYHNRWANEHVKEYDNEQYKLLDPKLFRVRYSRRNSLNRNSNRGLFHPFRMLDWIRRTFNPIPDS